MKIRTILEDELEIILELCSDLFAFHAVLFSIDLKSCLFVWKLYAKLAREHCTRLRYDFNWLFVHCALVIGSLYLV